MEELSDGELLKLSEKGNEEAFLILFRRHEAPVFRFSLHMSGQREIAEDVTQDVFLTLLSKPRRYAEEHGELQAYLIGVARKKVRQRLAKDWMFHSRALGQVSIEVDPVEHLSTEQELDVLRTAILSLPVNYREVVVLCELENASYAQAAHQLNCAIGTVRSRLHRARTILAVKLRKSERCTA